VRVLIAITVAAMVLFAGGCTARTAHSAASPAPLPSDPHTSSALLMIATAFNHDYDIGDYGPVYTRWDARSQAIITRADYIRRHKDCPSGSHTLSQTESVSPGGPHGAWLVHYQIGGQQLTDYWFYVHRRWVFDLVLSNPDAVKLYRMSPSSMSRLWAAHTDPSPGQGKMARAGGWLGGWPAGHELAAGVLIQAVEEPAGDGQRVVVGFAG